MKMLAPNETWWAVLAGATFNPLVPTASALLADITASKCINMTLALEESTEANPTDSETSTSRFLADEGTVNVRGGANYEGSLSVGREADKITNTTSEFLLVYNALKVKGTEFTLVRRFGRKFNVAPAATHEVDIMTFRTDNPRTIIPGDASGPILSTIPLKPRGYVKMNVALA